MKLTIEPLHVLIFGTGVLIATIHPLLGIVTYTLLLFHVLNLYFKSK